MSNFSEIFMQSKTYIDGGVTIKQIEDSTAAELVVLLGIEPDDVQQFTERIDLMKRKLIGYATKQNNIKIINEIESTLTSDQWKWIEDNIEFLSDTITQQDIGVPNG